VPSFRPVRRSDAFFHTKAMSHWFYLSDAMASFFIILFMNTVLTLCVVL